MASLSAGSAERITGNRYYGRTVVYQRVSINLTGTARRNYDAGVDNPGESVCASTGNGYYERTAVYQRVWETLSPTPRLNCSNPDTKIRVTKTVLHTFGAAPIAPTGTDSENVGGNP